jgi:hypothetical protein
MTTPYTVYYFKRVPDKFSLKSVDYSLMKVASLQLKQSGFEDDDGTEFDNPVYDDFLNKDDREILIQSAPNNHSVSHIFVGTPIETFPKILKLINNQKMNEKHFDYKDFIPNFVSFTKIKLDELLDMIKNNSDIIVSLI